MRALFIPVTVVSVIIRTLSIECAGWELFDRCVGDEVEARYVAIGRHWCLVVQAA